MSFPTFSEACSVFSVLKDTVARMGESNVGREETEKTDDLLSLDALEWLKKQGYAKADHKTRMELIKDAREMFAE